MMPYTVPKRPTNGDAAAIEPSVDISVVALTYDLSRFGAPDGQLQLAGNFNYATYEGFNPDTATFHFLAYYQTLFDQRLEIKFGLVGNQNEFVGQNIGGGFASTGGPANSIITLLGMSASPVSTWSFRVTGHIGNFYNETAVMRSLVVNGPTGNALFDTNELNPTRLDWNVNTSSYSPTAEVGAPGTGAHLITERPRCGICRPRSGRPAPIRDDPVYSRPR